MSSSRFPALKRITVISTSADVPMVSAERFESTAYRNRARLPVWGGAYLLGGIFTLLWFMALSTILQRARPVEIPEIQELEMVTPQAAAPAPTVVPPEKPKPPAPKPVPPKTREPPPPQPLVAPTTNENSPLAPVLDPPPTVASPSAEAPPTAAVEASIAPLPIPAPIKVEPTFRLTRLPGIGNVMDMQNYPVAEKNRGREGTVIAEFTIDEKGAVRDIKIKKSAGALFDQAVIDHLNKTIFSPGYIGERPVAARIPVKFNFKLD